MSNPIHTTDSAGRTTPGAIRAALAALVARYGWRFSHLDAIRAGVPERVLFDAEVAGLARTTHASFHARVYLVFA